MYNLAYNPGGEGEKGERQVLQFNEAMKTSQLAQIKEESMKKHRRKVFYSSLR